ncbi:MAG: hypothetical protein IPM56_18980 [Ignavibacteriales bacterium]|nr:MAG: hypothetical protein IPM56_18980 [Ignavibacteriales bacterium]
MKNIFLILLIILFVRDAASQVELSAGMGITFNNTPSVADYINQNFAPDDDQYADFSSAVLFFVEGAYAVSETYDVGIEIGYSLSSTNYDNLSGKFELAHSIIKPSVVNYYVIRGEGYNVKLGGGAGLRIVLVDETLPLTNTTFDYSSLGFGFLLKAEGNTSLGGNLFANIGLEARYDLNGEPERNGTPIYNPIQKENVNFNSLSFGIRLGVMYRI